MTDKVNPSANIDGVICMCGCHDSDNIITCSRCEDLHYYLKFNPPKSLKGLVNK